MVTRKLWYLQCWCQSEKVPHYEIYLVNNSIDGCIMISIINFLRINIDCNNMLAPDMVNNANMKNKNLKHIMKALHPQLNILEKKRKKAKKKEKILRILSPSHSSYE